MKINVGVFFGGKSVEHEVSVITAVEAMNAMDQNKYNIIPIYITKEGEFYTGKNMLDIKNFKNIPELLDKSTNVNISVNEKEHAIINNEAGLFFWQQKFLSQNTYNSCSDYGSKRNYKFC